MGLRVDVGIDPYIETVGAYHSSFSSVPVRGGRLVAAPTGYWEELVHEVAAHAIVVCAFETVLTFRRRSNIIIDAYSTLRN